MGRLQAPALVAVVALLVLAPGAHAATVSVEGDLLRVMAAPAETNALTVTTGLTDTSIVVTDTGAPLMAGGGCTLGADGRASCSAPVGSAGFAGIQVDAGDLDDSVSVAATAPATILGGEGDDGITGGEGDDRITGGEGDDRITGGEGNDRITGGDGDDALIGDGGSDFADGGRGDDSIDMRDDLADSVWCGRGFDSASVETLDALDLACESVDYGPPGKVGRARRVTGGGRLVAMPGQTWNRVDRRILPDVLYLVRRYRVRVTEGYGTVGHDFFGEHPLGLAVDIEPGAGGTWADVSRAARWAEPRQNHPRFPFRWVGWNGDYNHGHPSICKRSQGCAPHLHLSWSHSRGTPRRPVRTVWVFAVR